MYLADTSVLARRHLPAVRARVEVLHRGLGLATCAPVLVEIGAGVAARAYDEVLTGLAADYRLVPVAAAQHRRALDVQRSLARRSEHLGLSLADLLIAAAAEDRGLTVLHYDADFERIASVTGQPVHWVVPRGSLP